MVRIGARQYRFIKREGILIHGGRTCVIRVHQDQVECAGSAEFLDAIKAAFIAGVRAARRHEREQGGDPSIEHVRMVPVEVRQITN